MNPHTILEARTQVNALLLAFPELKDDAQLRADVIEGETTFMEVMRLLVVEASVCKQKVEAMTASVLQLKLRQSRLEMQRERIRSTLLSLMQTAGLTKCPLPEATLTVTATQPELIMPDTIEGVPEQYIGRDTYIVWGEYKKAIKQGLVPKPHGMKMTNGGASLTIRS